MDESKTFFDTSLGNRIICYDINENGLSYRPSKDEITILKWTDIKYIEDCSGDRVDIYSDNQKEVPIRYVTRDFNTLLKTICAKLSELQKEGCPTQKFSLTLKTFFHLCFVGAVLVVALISSLFAGKAMFILLLAIFVPLGVLIYRQPISFTLGRRGLTVRYLFVAKSVKYDNIQRIDLHVKTNDYGSTLCILIDLKTKNTMTIKNIENIILFYIMLQIKFNEKAEANRR